MSLATLVNNARVHPSITTWTRLEPRPRDASLARSLQAQIRDPLWMLARQWQVGEFAGSDGGSPVEATLTAEFQSITSYRPGRDPAATMAFDPRVPLEAHVERESVEVKLRGAVQLGMYFEALVRRSGIASPGNVIARFRDAFPIAPAVPDPTYAPADAIRFRSLMAGRTTDGEALYVSAAATLAGHTPPAPLPSVANSPGMHEVLQRFVAHRASLFSEPDADPTWQSQQLRYAFAIGSPAPGHEVTLEAPEFPGGTLDWHAFSLASAAPAVAGNAAVPAPVVTTSTFGFLPSRVTFRGIPDPRWWTFEDSVADFGQMDVQHVDLAKLLVMEFALIYGNDWFSVPVPTPIGNLARVTTLVVADTFGVRTLIRPTEPTWSMFTIAGNAARSDFIVMASTLGVVQDAESVESVLFLRDDMSAMAWAVEHRLAGDLDMGVDAHEAHVDREQRDPPPPPPVAAPDGPRAYYTVEIPSPDNWIPLLPVTTAQGARLLRRAIMEIPTSSGIVPVVARAKLLDPGQPFVVDDRTVPRAGVAADRYFRRSRAPDGTTFLWLARRSQPGTGPGWSGLRFDAVRDMAPPPDA